MTNSGKKKTEKNNNSNRIQGIQSFNYYFIIFFTLLREEYVQEYMQKRENSLKIMKNTALQELNLNRYNI